MSDLNTSPDVLAFRLERVRRAPRNWALLVSAFTLINGGLVLFGADVVFLAGLVAPFLIGGWITHFAAGATLLLIARVSSDSMRGAYAVLGLYALDAVLAGVLGLWSGVAMHAFVFLMLGLARIAVASLGRQLREARERHALQASDPPPSN